MCIYNLRAERVKGMGVNTEWLMGWWNESQAIWGKFSVRFCRREASFFDKVISLPSFRIWPKGVCIYDVVSISSLL